MNGLPISAGGARFAAAQTAPTDLAPSGTSNVCWRNYVGVASLVACPTLLMAFISLRYGLAPLVGLRAFVALYALGVVPGYLVQRYVLRLSHRTPFEDLASSWLLGTLLVPALWYVCCCVGISFIFYPTMFALATTAPLALGWHRNVARRLQRLVCPAEAPILWVALALAVLWSWQLSLAASHDGQVVIMPHDDHLVHTSLVAELARGVPPATVPFIAIADKWAYHYLPDVWVDMIRRVVGTDARDAYFYLALPLRYVLVSLACYLALVRRFGRPAAVVGAACVLGFTGHPGSMFILTNWLQTYFYWNYPCSFGLVGVFLILYYVSMMDREHPRGTLLLISILSALLFWHKANIAMTVVPAVSTLCVVVLARHRDYRWMLLCLGSQGLLVGVLYLDISSADLPAPLIFEPFRFVRYMWWKGTLWLKALEGTGPAWLALAVQALISIRRNVDALPYLLKWPIVFVLSMVYLFHLGLLTGLYARARCGFGRLRSKTGAVDGLILLILLFCAAGFILFPVQKGLVWNVCMHIFALVYALLLALMGPMICDLVGRIRHKSRPVIAVVSILFLTALAGNTYALGRRALGPTSDVNDVISNELYACYRNVETDTPPDAMILVPRFEEGLKTAAMLTQRRVVLEWGAPVWENRIDLTDLIADLRTFYRPTTPDRARAILDRYDVDYVVGNRSLTETGGYQSFLTPTFSSGNQSVYRVKREPGSASSS